MPVSKDLTDKVFTYLTVLEKSNKRNASGSVIWRCSCKCGNVVYASTGGLNNGDNKSCGCRRTEVIKEQGRKNIKHGASQTKIKGNAQLDYKIWCSIKERCYSIKSKNYIYYGARGIGIYDKWKENFKLFSKYIRTLKNRPSDKILTSRSFGKRLIMSLDRKNNDGNYEPGNLKWSTQKEQCNNKRSNKIVEYRGETLTLTQAVEKYGVVGYKTVQTQLGKGWTLEKALTTHPLK